MGASVTHEREIDHAYKWRAFAAIGLSFVTMVMSMTMVFVALDPIAEDFGVTLRAVGWVVIVESLIISAFMLPFGRLADAIGRKKVHLAGLVFFGLGAAATALAPAFGLLIVGRVIMAFGNAMAQSVGTAMIVAVFPPEERGKAIGGQTTAVSIGGASGPILGGLVLEVTTWNVMFLALLVPVVVSIVAGFWLLDEDRVSFGAGASDAKFDVGGALASGVGVAALVVTVSNPFAVPWLSPTIGFGVAIAVVAMVLFVRLELRHEAPILELGLFSIPTFAYGIAARVVGFAAFAFGSLLFPVYLISVRDMATGRAGLVLFLNSVGMAIAAQIAGRSSDRIGARPLTVTGFIAAGVTALVLSTFDADVGLTLVSVMVFLTGFSLGMWNVPNNSSILGSVPPSRLGVTGAFTNLTRTIGTVLGQAVASAVVVGVMVSQGFDVPLDEISASPGAGAAFLDGWQLGFLIVVALTLGGLACSIRAGGTRPAPAPRYGASDPAVFAVSAD